MGGETENGAGTGGGGGGGVKTVTAQHSFFVTFKSVPVREPMECVVGEWVEREFTETFSQSRIQKLGLALQPPPSAPASLMSHSHLTQTNLCLPAEQHLFLFRCINCYLFIPLFIQC